MDSESHPKSQVYCFLQCFHLLAYKIIQNTEMHYPVVSNLLKLSKKSKKVSFLPLWKINTLFQATSFPNAAYFPTAIYFIPSLQLLYSNNWNTKETILIYRISKSSHLPPVSILKATKTIIRPCISSAPFSSMVSFP